jgi:hypothetical protein
VGWGEEVTVITNDREMSKINEPRPLSFSLYIAQRLVDTAFSPVILLNFPIIRINFPLSFILIIAIDMLITLIVKWSTIYTAKSNILVTQINQAYPEYKAVRQIFDHLTTINSFRSVQTKQFTTTDQSPQAFGQQPFITTIFDFPRRPALDTPAYPKYLSLVFMISTPLAETRASTFFTFTLAEAKEYPRFFIALLSLLLYFVLTIKEKALEPNSQTQ